MSASNNNKFTVPVTNTSKLSDSISMDNLKTSLVEIVKTGNSVPEAKEDSNNNNIYPVPNPTSIVVPRINNPTTSRAAPVADSSVDIVLSAQDGASLISIQSLKFPIWTNKDALCWLNSALALLFHSCSLKRHLQQYPNQNSKISSLLNDYNNLFAKVNSSIWSKPFKNFVQKSLVMMQDSAFSFLVNKQMCRRGTPDSPIFAIRLFLEECASIQKLFSMNHKWKLYCKFCDRININNGNSNKTIISFQKISNDFKPSGPYSFSPCIKCNKLSMKHLIMNESMPESIIYHFEEGVPNKDILRYDFQHQNNSYILKGLIQFTNVGQNQHFVTWIRDPTNNLWLNCNDLQTKLFGIYSSSMPDVKPAEIHLILWERISVGVNDSLRNAVVSNHRIVEENIANHKATVLKTEESMKPISLDNNDHGLRNISENPPNSKLKNVKAEVVTSEEHLLSINNIQIVSGTETTMHHNNGSNIAEDQKNGNASKVASNDGNRDLKQHVSFDISSVPVTSSTSSPVPPITVASSLTIASIEPSSITSSPANSSVVTSTSTISPMNTVTSPYPSIPLPHITSLLKNFLSFQPCSASGKMPEPVSKLTKSKITLSPIHKKHSTIFPNFKTKRQTIDADITQATGNLENSQAEEAIEQPDLLGHISEIRLNRQLFVTVTKPSEKLKVKEQVKNVTPDAQHNSNDAKPFHPEAKDIAKNRLQVLSNSSPPITVQKVNIPLEGSNTVMPVKKSDNSSLLASTKRTYSRSRKVSLAKNGLEKNTLTDSETSSDEKSVAKKVARNFASPSCSHDLNSLEQSTAKHSSLNKPTPKGKEKQAILQNDWQTSLMDGSQQMNIFRKITQDLNNSTASNDLQTPCSLRKESSDTKLAKKWGRKSSVSSGLKQLSSKIIDSNHQDQNTLPIVCDPQLCNMQQEEFVIESIPGVLNSTLASCEMMSPIFKSFSSVLVEKKTRRNSTEATMEIKSSKVVIYQKKGDDVLPHTSVTPSSIIDSLKDNTAETTLQDSPSSSQKQNSSLIEFSLTTPGNKGTTTPTVIYLKPASMNQVAVDQEKYVCQTCPNSQEMLDQENSTKIGIADNTSVLSQNSSIELSGLTELVVTNVNSSKRSQVMQDKNVENSKGFCNLGSVSEKNSKDFVEYLNMGSKITETETSIENAIEDFGNARSLSKVKQFANSKPIVRKTRKSSRSKKRPVSLADFIVFEEKKHTKPLNTKKSLQKEDLEKPENEVTSGKYSRLQIRTYSKFSKQTEDEPAISIKQLELAIVGNALNNNQTIKGNQKIMKSASGVAVAISAETGCSDADIVMPDAETDNRGTGMSGYEEVNFDSPSMIAEYTQEIFIDVPSQLHHLSKSHFEKIQCIENERKKCSESRTHTNKHFENKATQTYKNNTERFSDLTSSHCIEELKKDFDLDNPKDRFMWNQFSAGIELGLIPESTHPRSTTKCLAFVQTIDVSRIRREGSIKLAKMQANLVNFALNSQNFRANAIPTNQKSSNIHHKNANRSVQNLAKKRTNDLSTENLPGCSVSRKRVHSPPAKKFKNVSFDTHQNLVLNSQYKDTNVSIKSKQTSNIIMSCPSRGNVSTTGSFLKKIQNVPNTKNTQTHHELNPTVAITVQSAECSPNFQHVLSMTSDFNSPKDNSQAPSNKFSNTLSRRIEMANLQEKELLRKFFPIGTSIPYVRLTRLTEIQSFPPPSTSCMVSNNAPPRETVNREQNISFQNMRSTTNASSQVSVMSYAMPSPQKNASQQYKTDPGHKSQAMIDQQPSFSQITSQKPKRRVGRPRKNKDESANIVVETNDSPLKKPHKRVYTKEPKSGVQDGISSVKRPCQRKAPSKSTDDDAVKTNKNKIKKNVSKNAQKNEIAKVPTDSNLEISSTYITAIESTTVLCDSSSSSNGRCDTKAYIIPEIDDYFLNPRNLALRTKM